jgi:hypothetical protein
MATSPIYNWPEPDNTDLVKNGALAIRTLGNAIDTTMGTMTPKSIVDAKGDLIAATANDTPARLAVGANGETLVADSSTSTGLRYQGSMAAGKNFLINGGFDIWQRGTSFSNPAGAAYTADRWNNNNLVQNTQTVSQQTTGVPAGSQYCLRTAYGAASSYSNKAQIIETNNTKMLQGKTVTFTVKVRRNASFTGNLDMQVSKASGTDIGLAGSWSAIGTTTITNAQLPTATTSADWFTGSLTVSIPNDGTANTLKVSVAETSVQGSGAYFEMAEAQLELGSVGTAFSRTGGTIQGELAACQRYYWRAGGDTNFQTFGVGTAQSTTAAQVSVQNPVPMRVAPTSIEFSTLGVTDTLNTTAATNVVLANVGKYASSINITTAGSLTAWRPYILVTNNSTSGYFALGAEL